MILSEELQGGMVIRHWSDQGMMIKQVETDTLWPDAVDVVPCQFTYVETDTPITDGEIDAEEALQIITGVVT